MLSPKNQKIIYKLFYSILLCACFNTKPLFAVDCFSESLNKIRGDDLWKDVQTRDLSKDEYSKIKNFFNSIKGNWVGEATSVFCKGKFDAPIEKVDIFTIKSKIDFESSEKLSIDSNFRSESQMTNRQEVLNLFLLKNRLRIRKNAPTGDIELIEISDDVLAFLEKNNSTSFGRGGVVVNEIVFRIEKQQNDLDFEFKFYSNGILSNVNTWKLTKK